MLDGMKKGLLKALNFPNKIVTRDTDPNFMINFGVLPNPDPILAKMGKDQDVYAAMQYDPHIMGELRSLRSGLLGYEYRFVAGADDVESLNAVNVIQDAIGKQPAKGMRWNDFHWGIYKAILEGQSIYEMAWEYTADGLLLPSVLFDRPARRFRYSIDNELRFLTQNSPLFGEDAPSEKRFLVTRHMSSYDNPYGVAVMSACFWSYTFKHAGFKWFAKFAEKYGIPWAIGRYPEGSDTKVQNALAESLQAMIEDAVAAIPEGNSVELIEPKTSGDPVQERLINLCNREMSKALTSQTLATEIQGNGSRAASETHQARQDSIAKSDRTMVSDTVNQLLEWITELNFKGATAPYHEFYQEEEARKEWAEVLDLARHYLPISTDFAYKRLQITPPEKGADLLGVGESASLSFGRSLNFGKEGGDASKGLAVDDLVDPIFFLLGQANNLEDFQDRLLEVYPELDDSKFADYMALALSQSYLQGVNNA